MAYIFLGKGSRKNANFRGLKIGSPNATSRRESKKQIQKKTSFFSEKKPNYFLIKKKAPPLTPVLCGPESASSATPSTCSLYSGLGVPFGSLFRPCRLGQKMGDWPKGALHLQSMCSLANGVAMPIYGLGLSHNGGFSADAVGVSLQLGVPMLDTAKRYGNEQSVGEVLHELRKSAFLTTKLWPGDASDVTSACASSCKRLGVDVLDLYLVHWPGTMGGPPEGGRSAKEFRQRTWRQMELQLESGRCKAIGVSNFLERHLDDLMETASVMPHVNQIEFNPFQFPAQLQRYCIDNRIQVEGYCPLAKGGSSLGDPTVARIAAKHNCEPAQILIRWSLQHQVITIPKSTSDAHIRSNLGAFNIQLDADDMSTLDGLNCDLRVTWDPTDVP
jgi:diketogulonate reductase-like aldo/keto reductase